LAARRRIEGTGDGARHDQPNLARIGATRGQRGRLRQASTIEERPKIIGILELDMVGRDRAKGRAAAPRGGKNMFGGIT
jgi:hypothetical protein